MKTRRVIIIIHRTRAQSGDAGVRNRGKQKDNVRPNKEQGIIGKEKYGQKEDEEKDI